MKTKEGEIIIRIEGSRDKGLSASNFDISQLKELLGCVEKLTMSSNKDSSSKVSLVSIENGSVKHVFKTNKEFAAEIALMLSILSSSQSLNNLPLNIANTLKDLQKFAIKHGL